MGNFSDLVASLDATVLNSLSDSAVSVTINPTVSNPGGPSYTLQCLTKNPVMEEDYVPGAPNPNFASVLILFVHPPGSRPVPTLVPAPILPINGDTATVNGVPFDIFLVQTDRAGGMTLRLRARNTGN